MEQMENNSMVFGGSNCPTNDDAAVKIQNDQ